MDALGFWLGRLVGGRKRRRSYPGLKPWAILFSHFVAIAHSPLRRFAPSPTRRFAILAIGYSEIPVALDVALAYDFAAAVDQVEFAEFVVFILQIDCPVAAPGSGGIGTPG